LPSRLGFRRASQLATPTSTYGSLYDQSTLIDERQEVELVGVSAEAPQPENPADQDQHPLTRQATELIQRVPPRLQIYRLDMRGMMMA
jgi:hypothetical protein